MRDGLQRMLKPLSQDLSGCRRQTPRRLPGGKVIEPIGRSERKGLGISALTDNRHYYDLLSLEPP